MDIQLIRADDDAEIKSIIEQVGREFGAIGEGFGPSDEEVANMSLHYLQSEGCAYFVARLKGKIVGGAGIAPFDKPAKVCELKKLFLLPNARGYQIGEALSVACLEFAAKAGYHQCYLDTLASMNAAIALYSKLGFVRLEAPLAASIHNGCDIWMLKNLS